MQFSVDSENIERYGVYNAVLLGYLFAIAERKGRDKWFQISTKQIYKDLGIGEVAAKKILHFWYQKGIIARDGDATKIVESECGECGVVKSSEGEIQCPHCENRQSVEDKQVCVFCRRLIWNFEKQKRALKASNKGVKDELATISK